MFHDRMTALADKLIPKYGDDVTLVKKTGQIYNPDTGETTDVATYFNIKGFVDNYTLSEIDDIAVKVDDLRVLVSLNDEVTKDWTMNYLGKEWFVLNVTKIRTQNYTITQELQVRANG